MAGEFSKRLKKTLTEKGIKQKKLASDLHVQESTVSQWVNGVHVPDHETISNIASILNTTTDYLLGHDSITLRGKTYDIDELLDNMDIEIKAGGKPLTKAQREEARKIMRYVLREIEQEQQES